MSWYTKEKAKFFLKMGLTKKENESDNYVYFKVSNHNIIYDKRKDYWNCDCVHGSLWKGHKDEECSHILSAQIVWNNRQMLEKKDGNNL